MSWVVELPNNSYKPITDTACARSRLCNLQKGCTRLATASNTVYYLLAHDRWFSPASSTKTGRDGLLRFIQLAYSRVNYLAIVPMRQSGTNRSENASVELL